MNWLISLLRGRMFNKMLRNQRFGRGTMMSMLALGVGATAVGVARRRIGGNLFQKLIQPLRNQLFR